jgi:basic amino acid/polyamine antiporter, APA family
MGVMRAKAALRGELGYLSFFSLAFGSIVGSGWVVLLGAWLTSAGPAGALLGFAAGGIVMMAIGSCYSRLMDRIPETGGEFIYALKVFGPWIGFATGWFSILYLVSVTVFEALALPWLVKMLLPALPGYVLYSVLGEPIDSTSVLIAVTATIAIAALNYRGAQAAAAVQNWLTFSFLVIATALLLAALLYGHAVNFEPLWSRSEDTQWWRGAAWIFASCAFLLNGFQAIPMAIEERGGKTSLRGVAATIVVSIGVACAFYCFVIIAASASVPWQQLAKSDLAMVMVTATLPWGDALTALLLIVTIFSLLKTWNAVLLSAARMLFAMSRAGFFPARYCAVHSRYGSPATAVIVVGALNLCGIFFGKGAITPLVNMCAMMLTFSFIMCVAALLKTWRAQARTQPAPSVLSKVVLAIALVGACIMSLTAVATPLLERRFALEWVLICGWSLLGLGVFLHSARAGHAQQVLAAEDIPSG